MKKSIMLIILVVVYVATYAAGPAGIDTGLKMWLDASTLAYSNNDPVSSWTDQSGNNKHAEQATLGFQPTFKTSMLNGLPAVSFSTDDFLTFDGSIITNTNYSIFAVVKRTSSVASGSTSSHHYFLGGTNTGANTNLHVGWRTNSTFTQDQYSNEINTYVAPYVPATEPAFILSARHSSDVDKGKDAYINGGLRGLSMYPVATRYSHMTAWTGASIGRYIDGTINTRFNGWVAELIMYDRYLSETERKAVEAYLGAKYAITANVDPTGPSYYTDWMNMQVLSTAPNASATGQGIQLDVSFDTNFARVRGSHNALTGTIDNYNPNLGLYPNFERLRRVWYLEISGSNAVVDTEITFDLAQMGQAHFSDPDDYRIVYKRCSCANYEILDILPTVVGDQISFAMANRKSVEHSGFYTLATINSEDITLPVELSSFTAVLMQQNQVKLEWVAQSETGVLGYYVYRSRSADLVDAELISPMIDAQNLSTTMNYSFTDNALDDFGSYYYWLQSLDMNNTHDFHGPILVDYTVQNDDTPPIVPTFTGLKSVFPNPFNPSLSIVYTLKAASEVQISLYNTKGQKVKEWDLMQKNAGEHRLAYSADNLPSGVYLLKFKAGDVSETKRITLSK